MKRAVAIDPTPEMRLREAEGRHQKLDARLRELGRRAYLTPAEQREVSEIKKLKLQAKDEMTTLRPKVLGVG